MSQQLLLLLQQLDQRLEVAIQDAQSIYGTEIEKNPYRGVQINQTEVERLLHQEPGIPVLAPPYTTLQNFRFNDFQDYSPLVWLHQTFGLSDFDLGILAIALAPELDRRYERLYAYLQDDVRCKRPTVDLCLNLLCASASEKLTQRDRFSASSPLIQHGLLHLVPDPNQPAPTLLAHFIQLDSQVIRLLLGKQELDDRLHSWCQRITPQIQFKDLSFPSPISRALPTLIQANWQTQKKTKLYFYGIDEVGKCQVAEAIAHLLQVPLLIADLTQILHYKTEFLPTLNILLREALFQNTLLYLDGFESLQTPEYEIYYQPFLKRLAVYPGVTILAGTKPWFNRTSLPGVLTVTFPMLDFEQRRFYWEQYLQSAHVVISSTELDVLSDRLRLTSDQIANAVTTTANQVRWHSAANGAENPIQLHDLFIAARGISEHDLEGLARQIKSQYEWDDIVLPAPQKQLLREICNQIKYQHLVWKSWGFEHKRSLGKGLNVMFSGTPGTGKTMAAEVIAQELQLDLYKIDLSQIVSKYIGETEKNLNRIFSAAMNANAILLFDEADALFGRRTEVKDAHDRYANLEVSYLLQKMEEFEGLAILTTNLRSNMDDAFVRRLQFIVEFPFPDEKQRYQIWQQIFPKDAPCTELDFNFFARNFELSGANIRTVALTAAFLAAAENQSIEMAHVMHAIRREYQKMGKIMVENKVVSQKW